METKSLVTGGQLPRGQGFLDKIAVTDSSLEFEWIIPDFFLLEKACTYKRICPKFQYLGEEWSIALILLADDYYHIICNPEDKYSYLKANYTMGIKCSDGTVYKSVRGVVSKLYLMRSELSSRSALIKDMDKVVPQDVLTIFCSISPDQEYCETASTVSEEQTEISEDEYCETASKVSEEQTEISEGIIKLGQHLKNLLTSGEDTDVVMKVGDREFPAHRAILRARSTVFSSMFRHDMKERSCGSVEITDCDPQAFEQFLLYVYTGKVDCLSTENVCQLYQLSDKYDIQDLKTGCVEYMKKNLSADNFCDVISLALRHNESELIETTTQFFVKNAKKIVTSVNWLSFLKENPVEANELTIKMLNVVVPD